jgi:uncharacterized RDD family membrane protein YckC
MTMTANHYIASVLDSMPRATPRRRQIEMELQSLIAERLERGQPLADVLGQLGNPQTLAESYLAEVPLVSASFWSRAAAKIADFVLLAVVFAPIGWLIGRYVLPFPFLGVVAGLILAGLSFGFYTAIAEWRFGETVGKHMVGLRVVRESGARIGFGQSLVRSAPLWLEFFWIDVLFALFTERHQRAFELLSKTRVVQSTDGAAHS